MAIFKSKQVQTAGLTNRLIRYPIQSGHAEILAQFLTEAPDVELIHINPRWLARRLNIPVRETTEMLSYAVTEGLLNLNWEIQCPACRSVWQPFNKLDEFQSSAQCAVCATSFDLNLDDEVHVTFAINEAVRKLGKLGAPEQQWRQQIDREFKPFSGHELLTVQSWRDLFRNETLPQGESLQIKRAAFMFTDLGGSTALYARKGDPRAYRLVREHFDVLYKAVNDEGGSIVKTIGDAIMAVFTNGEQAFRAAVESQRGIRQFNKERNLPPDEALILKVGLHAGPCLSVTLNERLDYFGTTVNMAARVQGLSHGDDIVFSDEIAREEVVEKLISEQRLDSTEVQLKGFDYKSRVYQLEYQPDKTYV